MAVVASPPLGQIVGEMNRLGMIVDISHVADKTFWDALAVSKALQQIKGGSSKWMKETFPAMRDLRGKMVTGRSP